MLVDENARFERLIRDIDSPGNDLHTKPMGLILDLYLQEILDRRENEAVRKVEKFLYDAYQALDLDRQNYVIRMGNPAGSIGFTIQTAQTRKYIRFSTHQADHKRPDILAGTNAERSEFCNYDSEHDDASCRYVYVEALPAYPCIQDLKIDEKAKRALIDFDAEVIRLLGFKGAALNDRKDDDFAFRVFEKEDAHNVIDDFEISEIQYDGARFFLKNKEILVVPFMYDTEELSAMHEIPLHEQANKIDDLIVQNLDSFKVIPLPVDTMIAMGKCYKQMCRL